MHFFEYRDDVLHCEGVALSAIAAAVGTPFYVYSQATLERHLRVFDEAFTGQAHLLCFSVKACSNLAVLRALFAQGAGADIVSGGELYRALAAGCPPERIVFSGVGKRDDEIEYALKSGILAFNVESQEELVAIDRVAGQLGGGARAPVALRVNPDVDPRTHPYVATGLKKSKFGIPMADAPDAYRLARSLAHLEVRGIDCHIGSQLTRTDPFRDAVARVAALARELRDDGVPLALLDVGGGLGIPYGTEGEEPPPPQEYARAILEAAAPFAGLGLTLVCEPGRAIVGNAGVLVTRVLYRKFAARNFAIVDAAMNDLIRPAFYDSYHAIWPVRRVRQAPTWHADVVGPICESGDFLAHEREMPVPDQGDLLAVMSAGAYGFTMSSNYNSRPRVPEVMVQGEGFAVVRERETYEDLVRGEKLPPWLS